MTAENEAMLTLAERDDTPLHAQRKLMENLSRNEMYLDEGQRHRLGKVQHRVRRQLNLCLHTDS